MQSPGRNKAALFFTIFGSCLVALAVALNVGWILLNWRQVALLVLGIIFFLAIIGGLVLNTIFLVRQIRRNEQQDSFINSVTHELKTPIASIRLYLETLRLREVDETRRREFYDVMLADTQRLLDTVEQVLRAGRAGHHRSSNQRTVLDLWKTLAECVAVTRSRHDLPEGAIQCLALAPGQPPPVVLGDADELRTAISNLLDNAVKYSDKDVRIQVELADIDSRRIAVRITDHGIGIPPDQLRRVFNRFYRVPGHGMMRFKGTGLGLFIVRSIIREHGGRILAESEGIGRGSTFTFYLPRV